MALPMLVKMWRTVTVGRNHCLFSKYNYFSVRRNYQHLVSTLYQPTASDTSLEQKHKAKSPRLMLLNGFIQPCSEGIYYLLPLTVRCVNKLTSIIDKHLREIGAQKLDMPCILPDKLWKKTNRWEKLNTILFKLKDRQERSYCLGPTHEEAISGLLDMTVKMHDIHTPLLLYQIGKKYRDELSSQYGLLRAREFLMKDMYSFDTSEEEAQHTYNRTVGAYKSIFDEIGIEYKIVEASTGDMGGSKSHEFHFVSEVGEDTIWICKGCDYAINSELLNDAKTPKCTKCDQDLEKRNSIEVGHTFQLGTFYTDIFELKEGKKNDAKKLHMGCFGIGITRIIAAVVEILSSATAMQWPLALAPYSVCIIPSILQKVDVKPSDLLDPLYEELNSHPFLSDDVIIDDRNKQSLGRRYMNATKTGYPVVLVLGKHAFKSDDPRIEVNFPYEGERVFVPRADVLNFVCERLEKMRRQLKK